MFNNKEYQIEYRKKYPERFTKANLKYYYNLNPYQYEVWWIIQGGSCIVCGLQVEDESKLGLDHNHGCCSIDKSCGKCIRGLLCQRCNTLIGMAKDDPLLLKAAIQYLCPR